jgi:site-specific recombinase XerD
MGAGASPGADLSAPAAREASLSRRRKLSAAHFAFIRGLVQGLDVRQLWDRYLHVEGSADDLRVVRSTIRWIKDDFAAAARRERRFGVARLVLLDPSTYPDGAGLLPTLAAFAEQAGMEDFSEAEQISAYEERFGAAVRRQARKARIVRRQLDAIAWLEALVAQPPLPGDAVAAWLNPAIATRLEAANIFTLTQLVDRINGLGAGWVRQVRGVGAAKAERLLRWLKENEASIGLRVHAHASMPALRVDRLALDAVAPPSAGVRPLEKFLVPLDLNGERGLYRLPQQYCMLEAKDDYAALLAWLKSKRGLTETQLAAAKAKVKLVDSRQTAPLSWLEFLSNTQRSYRKEAERFLLWSILERKKPLSSLNTEDCMAYLSFLGDPKPAGDWCGDRSRPRWSKLWRPFEGPLQPSAQRLAVTVLSNMFSFWSKKNYTRGNPWEGVTVPRSAKPRIQAGGRSLTMSQWQFVLDRAAELPPTSTTYRLRFALTFFYASGLRLSEGVAAKVDHLAWVEYPPDPEDDEHVEGWMLEVVGKGDKVRHVPLAVEVISELSGYLVSRGLDRDPEAASNRGAYLLGKATTWSSDAPKAQPVVIDPLEGISASTLHDQLKAFFQACSEALAAQGDLRGAEKLARASTHWLRHTHASHSVSRGTPIQIEQELLGHASLATTTVYVTTESKRRMKAATRFWRQATHRSS